MLVRLAAVLVLALAAPAGAQCTTVGSPGGSGCGFSTPWGIPTVACLGTPVLGNAAFAIEARIPCQTTAPVLLLGPCLPVPLRIQGPWGAGGFCGPAEATCLLFVGPSIYATVPGVSSSPPNGFAFALPIPGDPALQGGSVCAQCVTLCPAAGGFCIGASNAVSVRVM